MFEPNILLVLGFCCAGVPNKNAIHQILFPFYFRRKIKKSIFIQLIIIVLFLIYYNTIIEVIFSFLFLTSQGLEVLKWKI